MTIGESNFNYFPENQISKNAYVDTFFRIKKVTLSPTPQIGKTITIVLKIIYP